RFLPPDPRTLPRESATTHAATPPPLTAPFPPRRSADPCLFQFVDDADFKATGYNTATSVACSPADLGSSFTDQNASADVTGLTPRTTYHFRAVATNADRKTAGEGQTFDTVGARAAGREEPAGAR